MSYRFNFNTEQIRIGLIFCVFLLFLSSAVGLVEFNVVSGLKVSVNSQAAKNFLILSHRLLSLDALLFIISGILLSVFLPKLNPVKASLLTLAGILLLYLTGFISHSSYSVIPFEYFILMILMLYIVNILISYFIEVHSKQKILEMFGHYLPPHIVEKISDGQTGLSLDGEAKYLTVMFCDIQSFTRISEELNPKQLVKLLNEYFTALTEILFRHNATIDKLIGDSVMAFWGAPLKQDNQAELSILCAMEMIEKIGILSEKFQKRGWPGPKAGIGINSGLMAVGNMGSTYRMAYTVIGDSVNVAARVEALTRNYQVPIIVSESTCEKCQNILFRELDNVSLKGKRRPTKLFQPLSRKDAADEALLEEVRKQSEALQAYYKKDFGSARSQFYELGASHNDDPYYQVMAEKMNVLCLEKNQS